MKQKALSISGSILKKRCGLLLLFSTVFVILFGFFPTESFAQFGFFNPLGSIVNAIGSALGSAIAGIIIGLFSGILGIAAILLEWAINPWFIKYSYTKIEGVVEIGWPVVRDFANMMLALALIAIALGTALRISEYQIQKTLPRLIIVALLINFTTTILGVIVDAANIIMNFFLEGFLGASAVKNSFTNFFHGMSTKNVFTPAFWLELMMIGLFSIMATILFLLFAILFIMRRVAIWILVILSPLAFVAWILPATRGFFNTWCNQFFQWTIIGVTAAFFLWLGNQMIILAGQPDFTSDVGGVEGFIQETFNQVAAYGVALIFLIFGFFMALQTSAIGARAIIAGGQTAARLVGTRYTQMWYRRTRAAAGATGRAARGWGGRIVQGFRSGWQETEGGRIRKFGHAIAGGTRAIPYPLYRIARIAGGERFREGWRAGGPAEALREWGRGVRETPRRLWERTRTEWWPRSQEYVLRTGRGIWDSTRDVGRQTWNRILVGYGLRPERPGGRTCSRCGARVRDNWAYCAECGREQPPERACPTCRQATPRGAHHCPHCGTRL